MSTSTSAIRWAEGIREKHAGQQLSRLIARLYSHHTQVRAGQPGLSSWADAEAKARLDEAVILIDAGLTLREDENAGSRDCLRRAAELLEWLPPSKSGNQDSDTTHLLLSAAAYQLAGYPARAYSIIKIPFKIGSHSNILRSFLRGMFHEVEAEILNYWTMFARVEEEPDHTDLSQVSRLVIDETVSALGIVTAFARWGDDDRLEAAIDKLDAVRAMLVRGRDQLSWLLAKLTSVFAKDFVRSSLRTLLRGWESSLSPDGGHALEQYVRLAYTTGRCQAWPSQRAGINRLLKEGSFALCTPTGSGKTSVAELAILQSVFGRAEASLSSVGHEPIAIYLVPSKALAAEVEGKMSRIFRRLSKRRVVITGLYGGSDWGPADAWLTSPDPAVLICTYEKGEALMRFLGPQFMGRVTLIVLDEAHSIRFDGDYIKLAKADSRAFRLESLGMRLLGILHASNARVIALSAVATGIERSLQSWVTNRPEGEPVAVDYRSTRQLIGKLLVNKAGDFEIHYDLLDRARLQFQGSTDTPYVQNTIPKCPPAPGWDQGGVEVSLRPPLLWAGMHLARDGNGTSRGVLISVNQNLGTFAKDCLKLLTETWAGLKVPDFFRPPNTAEMVELFERARLACGDIFGQDSCEYRLLERGIVMHHGGMPPSLGRLLVALVTDGVVNLVIATSTLSEGVNLPLEVVLIQSLLRSGKEMSAAEFANLAGRAGRPGVSSEGQTLVLLRKPEKENWLTWKRYNELIAELVTKSSLLGSENLKVSPLAELLTFLYGQWSNLTGSQDVASFHDWLERTAVDDVTSIGAASDALTAEGVLDTLDSLLLAAVVELEQANALTTAEDALKKLWQHSFAAHVGSSDQLRDIFLRRGLAIGNTVYTDRRRRRNLYRTGLPPRSASELLALYPAIREEALPGTDYAKWDKPRRLKYVTTMVGLIGRIKRFEFAAKASRSKVNWQNVLAWWLDPEKKPYDPGPDRRADWFKYVSHHFYYLFSWGIGSFIGVASAEAQGEGQSVWQLEDWVRTGLPWSVFWLKELVAWGTLDPAAAYLLSKGLVPTRVQAQSLAAAYYRSEWAREGEDALDPRSIRKWAEAEVTPLTQVAQSLESIVSDVNLDEDFTGEEQERWRVLPIQSESGTHWIDPAGFRLATSASPVPEGEAASPAKDFQLSVPRAKVESSPYL
ncbi:DEAD/DEAH box helicase [Limnoglobus roseus]|uniref:Helicase n=1 Tax=Limnoglobus roseus TaxID=2598579 RepID=A0A5C1AHA5_9BACT|nr:DEAD/DEAH box helicase [Limnoglobus roseus]QEL17376.1 helicase [Limnoglobus roseus]